MIRVIIKREVKEGLSVMDFLRQLRMAALPQPGYVTGETLVNTENRHIITTVSTWRSLDDWKQWVESEQRTKITSQIEPLLTTQPTTEIYELLSA